MFEFTFKIKSISVHIGNGPDRIYIEPELETTFPNMQYDPFFKLEAQAGYGIEWVKKVFGREPDKVIRY